ncbi:olfactory receptor 10AG1-like [Alligator sinensis]|uniref:Olfactory receptor n=1 Tax=Alligator sinensis TaxID=38654 RepID=A0A1U8DRJ9_ALLSI|nr:olfactory receptor 10AG1-like [Alligator sinensis]
MGKSHVVTEFKLLGFSNFQELQVLLFVVVLIIYSITLIGNSFIIFIIKASPSLQTPMYFFLKNLSFLDICYTSVTIPRMLRDLLLDTKNISYTGCIAQMCCFALLGTAECFLLSAMAYDRYIAICHPFQYLVIMNRRLCIQLVVGSWMSGITVALTQTSLIAMLPFCRHNTINHFFCDIVPLINLACGKTSVNQTELFLVAIFVVMVPFIMIVISYICIISTILRMQSADGKCKVFSTCSSHLMVVSLFYGTSCAMYLNSTSSEFLGSGKLLALLYTVVTPMLNPIIYSLRNKEIKVALRELHRNA